MTAIKTGLDKHSGQLSPHQDKRFESAVNEWENSAHPKESAGIYYVLPASVIRKTKIFYRDQWIVVQNHKLETSDKFWTWFLDIVGS